MALNVILNSSVTMPVLGFGVFQTPLDVAAQAVHAAMEIGYRLIDTAAAYADGLGVGKVFIETKVGISD